MFQRKNAAAGRCRSWPQETWEDCQICLAAGDALKREFIDDLVVSKSLISNLQAVVAASTQGEDRKEAPSDDLTPGACLLMLALWNVEVPQRPTGGDYGGRQTVQEAIVATICKPFRNTMDHTLWQWCFSRTNWKITTPAHPKFGTTL